MKAEIFWIFRVGICRGGLRHSMPLLDLVLLRHDGLAFHDEVQRELSVLWGRCVECVFLGIEEVRLDESGIVDSLGVRGR